LTQNSEHLNLVRQLRRPSAHVQAYRSNYVFHFINTYRSAVKRCIKVSSDYHLSLDRLDVDGNSGAKYTLDHWHRGNQCGLVEFFPRQGSAAATLDPPGEHDATHSKKETYDAKRERNRYELTVEV
jgi:hypothetical protein